MLGCGAMRTLMVLSRPTVTADSNGQGVTSLPVTYATVVGRVESLTRMDDQEAQMLMGQGGMRVTIPWVPLVKLGDQLTITDTGMSPTTQVWDVSRIEDDRSAHRWLRLSLVRDEEQL